MGSGEAGRKRTIQQVEKLETDVRRQRRSEAGALRDGHGCRLRISLGVGDSDLAACAHECTPSARLPVGAAGCGWTEAH